MDEDTGDTHTGSDNRPAIQSGARFHFKVDWILEVPVTFNSKRLKLVAIPVLVCPMDYTDISEMTRRRDRCLVRCTC